VTHHGQELGLGAARFLGLLLGRDDLPLEALALADVADDDRVFAAAGILESAAATSMSNSA
jgi:hypothetical protein